MKKTILTFEQKQLYPVDTRVQPVPTTPEELLAGFVSPIPAQIPGNVEIDLERAGILPELFFGTNILKLEDYELYDYWYRLTFDFPEKQQEQGCVELYLLFEGIDTLSEIWLNGERLGETDNMYIPHRFPVNGKLRETNELFIRIKSPVRYADSFDYDTGLWGLSYNSESVHIRKAPHSFGWDICPRAMGGGIFKNVCLVEESAAEIEDVYLHTLAVDYQGAHIRLSYDLKLPAEYYHHARIELTGICGEKSFSAGEKVVFKHGTFGFTVPSDQTLLWNPKGYGEQPMYEVTARLTSGETLLAEKKFSFGIRVVKLDFDPAGEEKKFLLTVNDVPVLCKGTNWVPLDAYHSRDRERMPRALELLKDCGANTVRCWGGNLYESEEFFDFCDRNGILVWQDFAMACNLYPFDAAFVSTLEKEVASVVKRIRTHTCLVSYCGDNEADLGMFFNGIDPSQYPVTRRILPELLFRFDPFRPFIPSSPYFSGRALRERDEQALSENHLWGPRNYFKSRFYLENTNPFISEIGYHGCPAPESVKKFIPEPSLWDWENDDWMAHQTVPGGEWTRDWNRNKLMAYQVRELFGKIPDNLEDFALCSQISQAEALKFFVEFTRLNKWKKTGIIWWNLLDCWPQFSDAVVDYYFEKKLAYAYLRRVQQPLCFMIEEPTGWTARAIIGNDGNRDFKGSYEIENAASGEIIASGNFFSKANVNTAVCDVPLSKNITEFFLLRLKTEDGTVYVNHYINFGGALDLETYRKFLKAAL